MNDKPMKTAEEAEGFGIKGIDLLNRMTGVCYPKALVCDDNTLGQILKEYAEDLGFQKTVSTCLRISAQEMPPATAARQWQD